MKKLLVILLLIGCGLNQEVNDPEFDVTYLRPFLRMASNYGARTVNAPVTIIYVDSLYYYNEPVAGLASIENKTISFNTSHPYWNSEARMILIYHELGHYYLGKGEIDESSSCSIPFSIMSLWSEEFNPEQFEYWTSGRWREHEEYYIEELFIGSRVWNKYPPKRDLIYHDRENPCWN